MSKPKFAFFSTELGPSIDPDEYDGFASLVFLDRDPIYTGSYDPHAGTTMRGSIIPTLGGVVIQDFGVMEQDQRITISDEAAISKTTVDELVALYEVSSAEYYFTDGYDCFKIQFARPDGLAYKRNLVSSFYGVARFDYTINLVVKEKADV
ncbi:MAG: hypothetical protein WC346_00175 [Methanogenium sp.]|jgi:hypothetical protein